MLVTAQHVFDRMPGGAANIGYRVQDKDGGWSLRTAAGEDPSTGRELFVHHPSRDVAAIAVQAPPEFAKAAIPDGLAGGRRHLHQVSAWVRATR